MKVLVTGGGGFLGFAIVQRLVARGVIVRTISRSRYAKLAELGVKQFEGDLADFGCLRPAIEGCDLVIHTAAKAGVWGPYRDYYRANVVATANVVKACRQFDVPRLIFTSSPSVTFAGTDQNGVDESEPYPKSYLAYYPRTKAEAERMVLAANEPRLATTALRPHLIWGPADPHLLPRLLERAKAGKLRRFGSRPNLIDTTFIDNAAEAHLNALDRLEPRAACAGRAYFISNGEPLPLWDFLNSILAIHHLPAVCRRMSPRTAYSVGALLEIVYAMLGRRQEPPLTRFVARQLATAHWFDLSAARRDLGYTPQVTIAEGLQRLASAVQRLA